MPPSNTKRTRAKREAEVLEASDLDLPSSPSQSVKKRRKACSAGSALAGNGEASSSQHELLLPEEDTTTNEEQIDLVVPTLDLAIDPVSNLPPLVSIDHANTTHERDYKNGVKAYAKIAGRDWTYYVKTLKVNIGRPPNAQVRKIPESLEQSSPVVPPEEGNLVSIDLSPSKHVSRLHAEIFYEAEENPCWRIIVNGRNGVKVNETTLKRGQEMVLRSGAVLEIGGTQMMFITPDEPADIYPRFLQRALTLLAEEEHGPPSGVMHGLPDPSQHHHSSSSQLLPHHNQHGLSGQIPLAPAPPPKRQSTPRDSKSTDVEPNPKPSPAYERGLMLETTEDLDLSLDSAKDIKPQMSYATMIGLAILSGPEEQLTLNSIYQWIMDKFAFYRLNQMGWQASQSVYALLLESELIDMQNSIRHNLSLNKSFEKIPRRTDEPGKGMKWRIVPEHREEFLSRATKAIYKAGHRGSSNPNSPLTKEVSSRMPTGGLARHTIDLESGRDASKPTKGLMYSPRSTTPPLSSYPMAKEAYTPDRGPRLPIPRTEIEMHGLDDRSPLTGPGSRHNHHYGLSQAAAAGSPPTLSSSAYLEDGLPLSTPAPRRRDVRLAPPSTARVPSSYVVMSSPAPFWKFDGGSTPAQPMADLSPIKSDGPGPLQSSSPPQGQLQQGSPSRSSNVRSFRGSGAAGIARLGNAVGPDDDFDTEEGGGGIDLARGFQPIGSYHSNMANATGAV
ncbi:MAG: hypothetical protein M1812_004480 [Candelaria pacifica]|nr:MAG: hypothetical protein M1812_004480 [Candelaria pacifica]